MWNCRNPKAAIVSLAYKTNRLVGYSFRLVWAVAPRTNDAAVIRSGGEPPYISRTGDEWDGSSSFVLCDSSSGVALALGWLS